MMYLHSFILYSLTPSLSHTTHYTLGSYFRVKNYVKYNDAQGRFMVVYIGGHMSTTTKAFLQRVEQEGIRICPFVDMDKGGLDIIKNLTSPGASCCVPERRFRCTNPLWIGVFPSQYQSYGITRRMVLPQNNTERTGIQAILNDQNHPIFQYGNAARKREEIELILTCEPNGTRLPNGNGNGMLANTAFMPENVLQTRLHELVANGI